MSQIARFFPPVHCPLSILYTPPDDNGICHIHFRIILRAPTVAAVTTPMSFMCSLACNKRASVYPAGYNLRGVSVAQFIPRLLVYALQRAYGSVSLPFAPEWETAFFEIMLATDANGGNIMGAVPQPGTHPFDDIEKPEGVTSQAFAATVLMENTALFSDPKLRIDPICVGVEGSSTEELNYDTALRQLYTQADCSLRLLGVAVKNGNAFAAITNNGTINSINRLVTEHLHPDSSLLSSLNIANLRSLCRRADVHANGNPANASCCPIVRFLDYLNTRPTQWKKSNMILRDQELHALPTADYVVSVVPAMRTSAPNVPPIASLFGPTPGTVAPPPPPRGALLAAKEKLTSPPSSVADYMSRYHSKKQ